MSKVKISVPVMTEYHEFESGTIEAIFEVREKEYELVFTKMHGFNDDEK